MSAATQLLQVSEVSYPPGLYQPRHAHSCATVTLILAGSLEERAAGRTERGLALGVVVKPAGVEHDDRFGTAGARTVQIAVPAAAAADLERKGGLLGRWRWLPAGDAAGPFLRLVEAMQSGSVASGELQLRAWDALGAVASDDSSGSGEPEPGPAPRWLEQVRERADDAAGELPLVRDLAAAAGVHPVHLAREFRRHYGVTVSSHLQRRRIQAAADLLVRSDEPLARVAARCGFADQSHLGRQLRTHAGITPARLRRIARPPKLQPF